ncbi:MAG: ABC transporter ATP-binding protein [Clostridia bacterium]|nr:ABC transporter ATP-binding protein [Clostridia bacterium]
MKNIIEVRDLHKSFGDVYAVQGISFDVREGELFAFLGVNGAGKSTTINILCGELKKDSGTVTICGKDADKSRTEIKAALGVVFQSSALDAPLTVLENLKSRGALYGLTGKALKERIDTLAHLLDFSDLLARPLGKLSGGQRRRIDIARALIHSPKILILDEPTTGLDPQTRQTLWRVISTLRREENLTVFLTTHYMEEAADADYVVILDTGKICAQGSPLELKNAYSGDYITFYGMTEEDAKALDLPYTVLRGAVRVAVADTKSATDLICSRPELFRDYEITKGKMDDIFLAVTGKQSEGGDDK